MKKIKVKELVRDCHLCTRYVESKGFCRLTGEENPLVCSSFLLDVFRSKNKKITAKVSKRKVVKNKRVERVRKVAPPICRNCIYLDDINQCCKTVGRVCNDKCEVFEEKQVLQENVIQESKNLYNKQLELF